MSDKLLMANLVLEYKSNLVTSEMLKVRRVEILAELKDLTNEVTTVIGDYKFTVGAKKANAPYKQIVTELLPNINLDAWRGPDVPYCSISAIKD